MKDLLNILKSQKVNYLPYLLVVRSWALVSNVEITRSVIHLPAFTLDSLKREFDISDTEVESLVVTIIEKAIAERLQKNGNGLTETEVKELEDDLKGLGYI